mgnify:CR=1 FL=1
MSTRREEVSHVARVPNGGAKCQGTFACQPCVVFEYEIRALLVRQLPLQVFYAVRPVCHSYPVVVGWVAHCIVVKRRQQIALN